jgi:hypothetical protein
MGFEESATRGDVVETFRHALITGSLWSVGIAWSTALRESVMAIIPQDSQTVVLGEFGAAFVTTVFGVTFAIVVARCYKEPKPVAAPEKRGPRRFERA